MLLQQSFNSLLQVFVVACSSLLRQYFFLQHIYFAVTKFPLLRQVFLWPFNTLSCKVCRSIHFMSQQSYLCFLEQLCCDINNCVATLFFFSFFKFMSRPSSPVVTTFLLVLVAASFRCCDVVYLCCRCFLLRPSLLCHDKTFCIQIIFLSRPSLLC